MLIVSETLCTLKLLNTSCSTYRLKHKSKFCAPQYTMCNMCINFYLNCRMSVHELRPEHKDILLNLPILKTLDMSGEKPAHFVSASVSLLFLPTCN